MKPYQKIYRKCAQVKTNFVARFKNQTTKGKALTVSGIVATVGIVLFIPLSAFFSDFTTGDMSVDLKIPNALQIKHLKLDTHTGIKTDPTLTNPTGDVTHKGDELVTFDHFVLSDIVTLSFDVTNIGNEELTVKNSVLKLAWDNASPKKDVKGYIYVYPSTMTDDAIRTNINAGGDQALTKDLADSQIKLNDGTTATGLEMPFATSALAPKDDTGDAKNYAFKVVYARDNDVKTHADFLDFNDQTLKVDIYTEGKTDRYTIIRDWAAAELTAETMPMMTTTGTGGSNQRFWNAPTSIPVVKNQVASIEVIDRDVKSDGAPATENGLPVLGSWDASAAQDGTVRAWYTMTTESAEHLDEENNLIIDGTTRYHLYIGGKNGVLAYAGGVENRIFSEFSNAISMDVTKFEVCESRNFNYLFYRSYGLQSLTGHEQWHTRNTTSMEGTFDATGTNGPGLTTLDLSGWDVSNVTTMARMFQDTNKLQTLDTTGWRTEKVTNMEMMFYNANALKAIQGVGGWDTGQVTTMYYMFIYAGTAGTGFSLDIPDWDVSNVTTMGLMFYRSGLVNLNAHGWQTTKVTDMNHMFTESTKLITVDAYGWDNAKVTTMQNMFSGANKLETVDATGWRFGTETTPDTNMVTGMFAYTTALKTIAGSENWEVSQVKSFNSMFRETGLLEFHANNWYTANVTNLGIMFYRANRLTVVEAENWNLSQVTNLDIMFQGCQELVTVDADGWNLSKATTLTRIFDGATKLQHLYARDWNPGAATTAAATNMSFAFNNTPALVTITGADTWDVSHVSNMVQMFYRSGIQTLDAPGWDASGVTDMNHMFGDTLRLEWLDASDWQLSRVTSTQNMFSNSGQSTARQDLDLSGWDIPLVTNMASMFYGATKLTTIDCTDWKPGVGTATATTNMQEAFRGTSVLETITGADTWDVSHVSNMYLMFYQSGIQTLDAPNWDVSGVTTMRQMFDQARRLERLDASNWQTDSVTTTALMFNSSGTATTSQTLDLRGWNLERLTTMQEMFREASKLTSLNCTDWNPGENAVTSLDMTWLMFYHTYGLARITGDATWNTSGMTSMQYMFYGASIEQLDADAWDVGKITTMAQMFNTATKLVTLNAANWDFGATNGTYVTMLNMFNGTPALRNLNGIENWQTARVNVTENMFYDSGIETLSLKHWDVKNLNNVHFMFQNCANLTQIDMTSWELGTSNPTPISLYQMFNNLPKLNLIVGLQGWDVSNVNDMHNMFSGLGNTSQTLELDMRNWNVRKLTNARNMFAGSNRIKSIDTTGWAPGAATEAGTTVDLSYMFDHLYYNAPSVITDNWDASHVTTMAHMFENFGTYSSNMALDLSSWNPSEVTDLSYMFRNARGLKTITGIDSWDISKVTSLSYMFANAGTTAPGLTILDLHGWNTSAVTNMSHLFEGMTTLVTLDMTDWQTGAVTDMSYMFDTMIELQTLSGPDTWDTSAVTTMSHMFRYNRKLSALDTISWDTSAVTTMTNMFYDTVALSSIPGIDGWDTSAVTDMSAMFSRDSTSPATTLATLDLSGWDVSNVTTMANMFNGAIGLTTLDVTGWQPGGATTGVNLTSLFEGTSKLQTLTGIDTWDTSQATTMNRMFQGFGTTAPGLTSLDLHAWDVSNVTTMASMFNGANKLQTLNTTGWHPKKVTTMNSMFYNATALNTITGTENWQTDVVTNLGYTFANTALTNLDLSGWNTAAVTNMGYTFNGSSSLATIDLKGWTTASITANSAMACMFQNTLALTNLDMRTADFDQATTVYTDMFRGSNIGGTTMIVRDNAVIYDLVTRLNLNPIPSNIITP